MCTSPPFSFAHFIGNFFGKSAGCISSDLPSTDMAFMKEKVGCCENVEVWVLYARRGARSFLSLDRVRTGGVQGNQIHSSTLRTLGIQKMYMGTLG